MGGRKNWTSFDPDLLFISHLYSYINKCAQSSYFEINERGVHAASCLGILGIWEPIANCVISTNLLLSQSGMSRNL